MPETAAVLCTKCGSASTSSSCAKCGGPCARVCGNCGARNSLAKNYCDQCGTPIGNTQSSSANSAALRRTEDAASGIPATVIFHNSPKAAEPIRGENAQVPPLHQPQPRQSPSRFAPLIPKLLLTAAATFIILGGVFAALNWQADHDPRISASNTATSYLNALASRDYATAYGFLSPASRRVTLEEFHAAMEPTAPGSWSDLSVEAVDPEAAAVKYAVKIGPTRTDTRWLRLAREGKHWVISNNLIAVNSARKALMSANLPAAQTSATKAVEIDPRDPAARALMCEICYGLSNVDAARRECAVALDLARSYPGELLSQAEYRLNEIMADIHKNVLNLPVNALDYYAKMLEFNGVPDAEICRILMARADTYVAMSRPGEALADLNRAAQHCRRESDKIKIDDVRRKLGAPTDY